MVLGNVWGVSSADVKTNHGLRCAKRLRVRWQPPPLFNQFTAVIHLHHLHEKAMPKFAPALAHFPYGARPESGGGCHRTLRRFAHRRLRSSTADEMLSRRSGAPWLCGAFSSALAHRPNYLPTSVERSFNLIVLISKGRRSRRKVSWAADNGRISSPNKLVSAALATGLWNLISTPFAGLPDAS
jgi:hypothetical protein